MRETAGSSSHIISVYTTLIIFTQSVCLLAEYMHNTHSLTAVLDQLKVVASSTSNDPGPRSRQHQQIGQCPLPLVAANFFMHFMNFFTASWRFQSAAGGVLVWASIDSCSACEADVFSGRRQMCRKSRNLSTHLYLTPP